jgi:hypothetical protein
MMNLTLVSASLTLSGSALAQPVTLTQVFSSASPPGGGPAFTSMPIVDVSPDGIVVISDRDWFPRNAYLAEPGAAFTRFAQFGFAATMPDGQLFGVNFGGVWAGRLPDGGPAVFGSDHEIGLTGAVVGQTITPTFWANQQLPDQPAGLRLAWQRFDKYAVSNTGLIAAAARLTGPGVTTLNELAIVTSSDTGPRLAFRGGSDPLGRTGVFFTNRDFSNDFAINDAGTIVLTAAHNRPNGNPAPAVLIADGSGARIVMDQDTPLPRFAPEERLGRVAVSLGINRRGDVAFVGTSNRVGDPPGRAAIFRHAGGVLDTVYIAGEPIEGIPSGQSIRLGFDALGGISPINDFGDIAFGVFLGGAGVSSANDTALCVYRADGAGGGRAMLIAREGDAVPGSSRTIGDFFSISAYAIVYMNTKRQFVFAAGNSVATRSMYFWSPSRGVGLLAAPGQNVAFSTDGTGAGVAPIVSIPSVTSEQRGNYWHRASGGADGRRTLLSDTGEVVFAATFAQSVVGLYRATLPPECLADFNADGFVDVFDYTAFVGAFESGDPASDSNGDGFLDFFDYDRFVGVFEGGC